jgi:hemerythrin
MQLEWSSEFETGIIEIDKQHITIIERINLLLKASEHDISPEEIDKIIRFFGGCIIDHFETEEDYMIKLEYQGYDEHRENHVGFLKDFSGLKRYFEEEQSPSLIFTVLKNQSIAWLVEHIKTEDKKMATFMKSKSLT